MVQDLDETAAIIDGILVWSSNVDEHDKRQNAVLDRARKFNLKLIADECEIGR
jgi:hypothetical protein